MSRRKPKPTPNRIAGSVEWVLKTYADPISKRLKVRTGLKAGGLCVQCGGNHSRRVLP